MSEIRSLKAEKQFWASPANYHEFTEEYWLYELKKDGLDFSFFQNKAICEVGCGPFGMIHFIQNASSRIGVDPLLGYYRSIGILKDDKSIKLIESSGEKLHDIPSESIDLVICYNVLDHTQKPNLVIEEINRILKPNGILYLNTHIIKRFFSPIRNLMKYVDRPHPHHFSKNDVYQLINEKFQVVSEKVYSATPKINNIKDFVAKLMINHYSFILNKR